MTEIGSETAMMLRRRQIQQEVLDRRIADFIKNYAPKDVYDRGEFDMALHRIVRDIYAVAQQPLIDQLGMMSNAALIGLPSIFEK